MRNRKTHHFLTVSVQTEVEIVEKSTIAVQCVGPRLCRRLERRFREGESSLQLPATPSPRNTPPEQKTKTYQNLSKPTPNRSAKPSKTNQNQPKGTKTNQNLPKTTKNQSKSIRQNNQNQPKTYPKPAKNQQ